jgi:hypothetical protein
MQKLNILSTFCCLLLCGTFAQAQSLNDFNDVRQLGVLLNPAHIGKADAKGELGVNIQMAGYASFPDFYGRARGPIYEISANYVHSIALKKNNLSLGLLASSRVGGWNEFNNIGLITAYTHRLGSKNRLSVGANLNILADKVEYSRLVPQECFVPGWSYEDIQFLNQQKTIDSKVFASINTGLEWQCNFTQNTYIKIGFAANNANSPQKKYDYLTEQQVAKTQDLSTQIQYIASLSSEIMAGKNLGFAPVFFYKMQTLRSENIKTMLYGGDIFFKNKNAHQWRIGYLLTNIDLSTYHVRQFGTASFRYQTPKFGIGFSLRALEANSATGYIGQTNFQYTF